ncbi:glycosyltransferase family 9 protein [Clavibacter michiganensis]|uniref:glycosyltransferase family 9 protein n=1 Tax=Clavibacter michiganensis TaxID=28447 RepID=UPI000CE80D18|nr:glycosyltransferase family 9 protein [Clavibacter michiganensis]PPF85735.1 glycosyltransferase family 9 protein [Clavibacter michiganensis]PPF99712.1 glycosyltransferase family 9 protein [Clavibacter michiganensis]
MPVVAPLHERFPDVRSIAVLRGGGLGDLIFALPAMAALRAAYPDARITLLGTPLHRALLGGRPGGPDAIEVLPVAHGVRDVPGTDPDPDEIEAFAARMRARRFDLAVQVHGGGRNSNPFLKRLGARHTVGTATDDAERLERVIPYVYYQHEVLRGLEVAGLAGAPVADLEPVVEVTDAERAAAAEHVTGAPGGLAVIHPGATDPRRRWPVESFAEVARRAAADDAQVVVVGDATDAADAERIVALGREGLSAEQAERITSLADALTLGELAGLFTHADVVLGNDSGPRHLAQAVGARTVGVFWFGNVINAAAFGRTRHRIHIGWTTRCPVCGVDVTQVGWTAERCAHDPSHVAGVRVEDVHADVEQLRRASLGERVGA